MTIEQAIQIYIENNDTILKYNEPLHERKSFLEWKAYMELRAKVLVGCCYDNDKILGFISEYSKKPNEEEMPKIAELIISCYKCGELSDFELFRYLCPILIEYYDNKNNVDEMLYIQYIYNFVSIEYLARGSYMSIDTSGIYRIISYGKDYENLTQRGRTLVLASYFLLISVCPNCFGLEDYKEAYDVFLDFVKFRDSIPQALKENDTYQYYNAVIESSICSYLAEPERLPGEAVDYLSKLAISQYLENEEELLTDKALDVDSLAIYYNAMVNQHKLTADEAIDKLFQLLLEIKDIYAEGAFFIPQYNLATVIIQMIKKLPYDGRYNPIVRQMDEIVNNSLKLYKDMPLPTIQQARAHWTMSMLEYATSIKELEELICNVIIRQQLPTYLHVMMVKKLSLAIFEEAYKMNKDAFASISKTEPELREYISFAALFHDIGKSQVAEVINRQGRKLTDFEFSGIMNHPLHGVKMIKNVELLKEYIDPILYHHKWYNGKGGYPKDKDNTSSKYRIITDIITIADCLDAATDTLGRNYKNGKKAQKVFEEFERDSGTRYNPMLVNLIIDNNELEQKLIKITEDDRARLMYDCYLEGLELNK